MTQERPRTRLRSWAETVVTAGLAAVIASLGGYLNEYSRGASASRDSRCDLAARVVEDDDLNRALAADKQRQLAYMAVRTLEHCLKE